MDRKNETKRRRVTWKSIWWNFRSISWSPSSGSNENFVVFFAVFTATPCDIANAVGSDHFAYKGNEDHLNSHDSKVFKPKLDSESSSRTSANHL
jgi:hypothetical protein